ncbi:MAG: hypothetical protein LBU43_05715 [Candidatus Accumulibacter sp.]|jgi:hypothetical protein|nr:hypothetical protein [Accumulibacter sp.]
MEKEPRTGGQRKARAGEEKFQPFSKSSHVTAEELEERLLTWIVWRFFPP